MATTVLNLQIHVTGNKMVTDIYTGTKNYDEWEANLWGISDDFQHDLRGPAGYTATREWGYVPTRHVGATMILNSASGNLYKFTIHLGKSWGTGNAYAVGHFWAKFSNLVSRVQSTFVSKKIVLEKKQGDYKLLLNCSDLAPGDWSDVVTTAQVSSGDTNILYKLTNSPTDPNATGGGSYLWAKYSDKTAPLILNVRPLVNEILRSPLTEISADFTDGSGSGIDLSTFQLFINKGMSDEIVVNQNTEESMGLIKVSSNGFLYRSIAPFKSQMHNIYIKISDNHGNVTEKLSSFQVDVRSYNSNIGDLPVKAMVGIGKVNAGKLNAVSINNIGDLVNKDAAQLTIDSGLSLKFCTTEIQRARIVCTDVRFIKGQFQELFSLSMNNIMGMTNQQLIALDIEVEDWQELENIRENIGLLYICIDKAYVDSMTFGQLTWDQV